MKNTLSDLNNHLFAQLERLNDESLDADGVALEVERSQAITRLGAVIVKNADTQLKAIRLLNDCGATAKGAMPHNIIAIENNGAKHE